MCGGDQFLEDAYVLVCELLPEEEMAVAAPPGSHYNYVFLCKQHKVLDFIGYRWDKQGNLDYACPQPTRSDLQILLVDT